MPDNKTLTGGCHCGQVRFECTTDLAMITACNCSICTKKGLHFTFLAPQSFRLRAGEDNLKEYLFNKHAIRHQILPGLRRRGFCQRHETRRHRRGGVERELHRRHRPVEADDDADRRQEQVNLRRHGRARPEDGALPRRLMGRART